MKFATFLLLTLPFAALLAAFPARAQNPTLLNEDNIRFFYQQQVDSYKWPLPRFRSFLQGSMTDNFVSDSTVTINFPGKPPQTAPSTQTRNSIVAHGDGEYNMMQGAHISIDITGIQIAPGGRAATVNYHSVARDIAINYSGGQKMSADSNADCTDNLILNDLGTIQIKNTKCVSQMDIVTGIVGGFGRAHGGH